jgi:Xaa-Pro aminopeptidase
MPLPDTATLLARQARIREQFDTLNIDALVVTSFPNIRYLANHVGSAGILVLTAAGAHLVVDFRYESAVAALQQSPAACPDLRVWPVPGSYEEALLGCLSELGVGRAGLESSNVTLGRYEWLVATAKSRSLSLSFRSTTGLIERARMVKDSTEIAILRDAALRLDGVVDAAFKAVRKGVAERAVALQIEAAMREAGYERLAFDTIVASGPNAALPHYRAGERRLGAGDLVVLDFGGVLDGYCCDITRTVSVGPPSARARDLYDAVHAAHQAAMEAVRPGVQTTAVDAAARSVLEARGLGPNFGHGTGHGLGLDVHEDPRVGKPRSDVDPVTVEAGMIFTIEPGAYIAGFGGVRIEDDVLVTTDGCEILTRPRRDLVAL